MSWRDEAACRGRDPVMFLERRYIPEAKAICATCEVREPCLAEANRLNHEGVRGGLSEKERGYRPWM